MSIRPLLVLAAAALVATATAAPVEDKWEITTSMEMVGMPFAMPPTKQTVCLPQNQPTNEKMVPVKDNCKVTKFTTSGNTSKFHVECPPPEQMSGDGEFTQLGKDAYKGSMAVRGKMQGEAIDMKMTYAGKKLGVCGANDAAISPTAMMAKQQAMVNQSCTQLADGMSWQVAPQMATSCPTIKADICKRAKTLFDGPKTSTAALDLQDKHRDWKELAGYCGIDTGALTGKYCGLAKKEQNWNNAALICGEDAELEALAKKECTGKMYSGAKLDDKWHNLCARYASKVDPGVDPNAKKAATPTTGDPKVDAGLRAVEGMKKLKGLFGN